MGWTATADHQWTGAHKLFRGVDGFERSAPSPSRQLARHVSAMVLAAAAGPLLLAPLLRCKPSIAAISSSWRCWKKMRSCASRSIPSSTRTRSRSAACVLCDVESSESGVPLPLQLLHEEAEVDVV